MPPTGDTDGTSGHAGQPVQPPGRVCLHHPHSFSLQASHHPAAAAGERALPLLALLCKWFPHQCPFRAVLPIGNTDMAATVAPTAPQPHEPRRPCAPRSRWSTCLPYTTVPWILPRLLREFPAWLYLEDCSFGQRSTLALLRYPSRMTWTACLRLSSPNSLPSQLTRRPFYFSGETASRFGCKRKSIPAPASRSHIPSFPRFRSLFWSPKTTALSWAGLHRSFLIIVWLGDRCPVVLIETCKVTRRNSRGSATSRRFGLLAPRPCDPATPYGW